MIKYKLRVLWVKDSRHKDGRSTALVSISLDTGSSLESEQTGFMHIAKGKTVAKDDQFEVNANGYFLESRESAEKESGEVKEAKWIVLH